MGQNASHLQSARDEAPQSKGSGLASELSFVDVRPAAEEQGPGDEQRESGPESQKRIPDKFQRLAMLGHLEVDTEIARGLSLRESLRQGGRLWLTAPGDFERQVPCRTLEPITAGATFRHVHFPHLEDFREVEAPVAVVSFRLAESTCDLVHYSDCSVIAHNSWSSACTLADRGPCNGIQGHVSRRTMDRNLQALLPPLLAS